MYKITTDQIVGYRFENTLDLYSIKDHKTKKGMFFRHKKFNSENSYQIVIKRLFYAKKKAAYAYPPHK